MAIPPGNYAFIDGANLHHGIRELGWKLDYKRFRIFLRDKYNVELAYLFMGFVPHLAGLYRDLQNWGYTMIFKPTLVTTEEKVKGNIDAELVLQTMIDFAKYSRAVIVTGDGDFACLVTYLEKQKKLEQIISPNYKKCSVLLKRAIPEKHLFLDRAFEKLGFRDENEKAPL
jgi:hypothetical protein